MKIWSILCEITHKRPFAAADPTKSAENKQCFQKTPRSLAHEHVFLRASQNRDHKMFASAKGASGDNLEQHTRGLHGSAFLGGLSRAGFDKKCTKQAVCHTFRTLRSHSPTKTYGSFACVSKTNEKMVLASTDGASGENLVHSGRVLRRSDLLRS